jgi:asparagine synthase (glutamine-hydrolysing)
MAHETARRQLSPTARQVIAEHLTYLTPERLGSLERCAREAPPGDFVEAGVALGGSAVVLASLIGEERQFHGYDVFGQIPEPGADDPPEAHERFAEIAEHRAEGIEGEYYGYISDLQAQVEDTLRRHSVEVGERVQLHPGLYEEAFWPERPVALAHIDCDWHDSVKVCLERVWPVLVPGGWLVIDDYFDWEGCRRAVDAFVADRPISVAARPGNLVLQRDG